MNLKIGIVGLPNVGKSTLFKALTKQTVEIANYPFATIDPHVGVVSVPDPRVNALATLSHSKKVIPATIEFVDIAGLIKGASEGEGLGNKFLSNIREVNAIAEVVRVFEDSDIIHVANEVRPYSDIETVEYELMLKDLETVEKRRQSIESELRARRKGAEEDAAALDAIKATLQQGSLARSLMEKTKESDALERMFTELQLLTAKPIIYIFNASETQIEKGWQPEDSTKIGGASYVMISARIEAELADLNDDERDEYLRALGIKESGLNQLIRTGYDTLGLMTYFTTGEDETRAWTIPKHSTAPRAGRAIHSDFEEKFIRAEVIHWQKLVEAGSWSAARDKGWLRIEGKEYIVTDGDVIEFRV